MNDVEREPAGDGLGPADVFVPAVDLPSTITAIRLAGAIREDSARVLANWAMRVAVLPVFRADPTLSLVDLQEDMPELLESILDAVSVSPYELDPGPRDQAAARAEAHGARRAQYYPIDAVIAEIQSLQREVRNAIWRLGQEASADVLHELDERLNEVFEIAERSVATAWVRYRYESTDPHASGAAA